MVSSFSSSRVWGFRSTQGLTVTGSGRRENGRYVGTLSDVIRDSYGFPVGDTLGCALVQLTTDKARADAHRFYERLGFVVTHEGMKLALDRG
jgi:hypothetical protein